jgi:hypothetical protein
MRRDNPPIIADGTDAVVQRRVFVIVLVAALLVGSWAALHYARLDLTLSHYDARAHLVVARRITDSLTPGWRQIGAVWLPLPHVLNLLPLQFDSSYRTGLPSALLSVASLALGLAMLGVVLVRHTRSVAAALVAPALMLLNPNILYLQSTPMTEPLLLGLSLAAMAVVDQWIRTPDDRLRRRAGWLVAALALTRYEGWCVGGALVLFAALALRNRGRRIALGLAPYYGLAIAGFLSLSKATTGQWFLDGGFFVPDNPAQHQLWRALAQIAGGTANMGGAALIAAAVAGAAVCGYRSRRALLSALPLTLLAAAALPWVAFYGGHPFRIRYMVPIVAASAVLAGVSIGMLPHRWRAVGAVMLLGLALWERPPLHRDAPMVAEAQWETPFRMGRRAVTRYLAERHDGTPVLASMGSLGHYMQEASAAGFDIADFVHEGNGDLWKWASRSPGSYVRWVLIEERAEGGDMLALRAETDPAFLNGFSRVADGGGLALYYRP